jgi:LacI family transcriptional regulator
LATIHDVARAAGVSIATVSRVLNGNARVSAESCQRVLAATAELDYWPNPAARSLRQSRTHVLGILLPDLYGEFFSEVIRGIDYEAREAKFQVLISSSHAEAEAIAAAARSMRGRVDGLVVMAPDSESAQSIDRIIRRFPVVLLNTPSAVNGTSAVAIANAEGARTAVGHLLALGHRTVAVIKGPRGNADAEERLGGYRLALAGAGIEPGPALEIEGDFTECSGFRAATPLLALAPRPSAVFATNDYMAIGLLSALGARAVRVPADMAVVGFDDIAIAQYVTPALTTVHVDAYELGARAVRLLVAAIGAHIGAPCRHEVLPATLVIRESSGARVDEQSDPTGNGRRRRRPSSAAASTEAILTDTVSADAATGPPEPPRDPDAHGDSRTRPSHAGRREAQS